MSDPINPNHYKEHPSGVECVTIAEHFAFNLGNAIKYIWRAGLKSKDPTEDLKKARWYLDREIDRLVRRGGASYGNGWIRKPDGAACSACEGDGWVVPPEDAPLYQPPPADLLAVVDRGIAERRLRDGLAGGASGPRRVSDVSRRTPRRMGDEHRANARGCMGRSGGDGEESPGRWAPAGGEG